jgi:hypothetical protein
LLVYDLIIHPMSIVVNGYIENFSKKLRTDKLIPVLNHLTPILLSLIFQLTSPTPPMPFHAMM